MRLNGLVVAAPGGLHFGHWETHAQAEAAAPVAATWVRDHLAERLELRSNQVGDLAFFEGVPATV